MKAGYQLRGDSEIEEELESVIEEIIIKNVVEFPIQNENWIGLFQIYGIYLK